MCRSSSFAVTEPYPRIGTQVYDPKNGKQTVRGLVSEKGRPEAVGDGADITNAREGDGQCGFSVGDVAGSIGSASPGDAHEAVRHAPGGRVGSPASPDRDRSVRSHSAVRGVPFMEARIADKLYDINWIDWLMHFEFS